MVPHSNQVIRFRTFSDEDDVHLGAVVADMIQDPANAVITVVRNAYSGGDAGGEGGSCGNTSTDTARDNTYNKEMCETD